MSGSGAAVRDLASLRCSPSRRRARFGPAQQRAPQGEPERSLRSYAGRVNPSSGEGLPWPGRSVFLFPSPYRDVRVAGSASHRRVLRFAFPWRGQTVGARPFFGRGPSPRLGFALE